MENEITLTNDDYQKILRIAGKAIDVGLIQPSKGLTLQIDIEHACKQFNLDLDLLLKFDGTFFHDIPGILKHIDRKTKKFKGCFVPRSARIGG